MKLVLIHGINQQGTGADALRERWLQHVATGLGRPLEMDGVEVIVPYYGDVLAARTAAADDSALPQGAELALDTDAAAFVEAGLREQASAVGVGPRQIAEQERAEAPGDPVEQGFPMGRRLNAIARAIEAKSPFHGDLAVRLLAQAHAYLKRPLATEDVDGIVGPTLETGPAVVVAHSLGTVVAFKLLRDLARRNGRVDVKLLVTLGSPLSLRTIKSTLGPPLAVPPGVTAWLNAFDPRDFVALGQGLGGGAFADGIEDVPDIANLPDDAHAIEGYLRDARVAQRIQATLRP